MHTLKKRTLEGCVQFIVALALLLFLPAWTIYFWQAWLYLILFSTGIMGITLYFLKNDPALIERRLAAGPAAEKETSQKRIQTLSSIFLILIFIISGLDKHFALSNISISISVLADVFVVCGLWIIFKVFQINTYTSGIITTEANQTVISNGPYALIRHPMYSGAIIIFIFTPIALGTYWSLVPAAALCILVVIRALNEERYLLHNLHGYTDYYKKVSYRIIPFIY